MTDILSLFSTSLHSLEISVGEGFWAFAFKLLRNDMQICRTAGALKKINENQLSIEIWMCGGHGSSPKRVIVRAVATEPCPIRGSKAGAAWSNLRFPHLSMYNML